MSLDTKYRPTRYGEVLGQEGTVAVLRQFVSTGHGFCQSYLFGGPYGSGKTTLARILARALLCADPRNGEPCDECHSCKVMLDKPSSHECFIEVDAATNSGKADVAKLTRDLEYSTFSGKQKIYLFDESHELSRQAFDALLLPMEDNRPGSQDKKLVCIFATTEPEKMRPAVLSRCAPAFIIRPCAPAQIAERLGQICTAEEIPHQPDALTLIAEATECHIRDAIKAVEGVSMVGDVDTQNVRTYLQMDANPIYLEVLENIGKDQKALLEAVERLLQYVAPATAYDNLAELAMLSYRLANLGVGTVPSFLDRDKLKEVGDRHGAFLIEAGSRFAKRPGRVSAAMLRCDLAALHQLATGAVATIVQTETPVAVQPTVSEGSSEPKTVAPTAPEEPEVASSPPPEKPPPAAAPEEQPGIVEGYVTSTGVFCDPRAARSQRQGAPPRGSARSATLSPEDFAQRLDERLRELIDDNGRPEGPGYLGGS